VDSAFALAVLVALVGTLTAGITLVRSARRLSRAATRTPLDPSAWPPDERYRLRRHPLPAERRHPGPAPEDELVDDDGDSGDEDWGDEDWAGQDWAGQDWGAAGWAAEEEAAEQAEAGAPAGETQNSKPKPAKRAIPKPMTAESATAEVPVAKPATAEAPVVEDLLSALSPEQRAIVIAFRRELDAAGRQADRKALYANLLFFAAGILASILVTLLVHPL
jgi:hypothetical protein